MKRIIVASGVLWLLAVAPANAHISVSLGFFEPQPAYIEAPAYVEAPIYPTYAVEPGYYHDRHDRYDRRGGRHHDRRHR